MKFAYPYCLALCLFSTHALAAESWLRPKTWDLPAAKGVPIAKDRYFEVDQALSPAAQAQLSAGAFVKLEWNAAKNYGRPDFFCARGTDPYLVRAVYTNHGTGAYMLERNDSALIVRHGSLGASHGTFRSALVVCLDFSPAQVFVESTGAM